LLLGLGLAAIYLCPALLTQDHVQMEVMHEGDMRYRHGFFFPEIMQGNFKVANSSFGNSLFSLMSTLVVVGLGAVTVTLFRQPFRARSETIFWGFLLLGSVFMMTPLSAWIYKLLAPLQRIQFPWRFGVVVTVADTALVAICLRSLRDRGRERTATVCSIGLLLLVLIISLPSVLSTTFAPRQSALSSRDAPEYLPRWVADLVRTSGSFGPTNVEILVWQSRRILCCVRADQETVVDLDRFYYPGWQAKLDGDQSFEIGPSLRNGLLYFAIPAGVHTVELNLVCSSAERLGRWISFASLMGVAGWGCLQWRAARRR
jgi:hypothetical protein